ncbi:ABC transporter permease [Marinoscillum sp.]|uniref:ABC transporter permease n=1 Tax=Marinoscillum sp. TaxID=2024838 RepID=UPI003BAAD95A
MALGHTTPRLADRLITWLCKERYAEEILGDLEEYYGKLQHRQAKFKTLKYWYQSAQFIRLYALKTPFKRSTTRTMLNMNLKIAVRSLKRDKFYSFINIFGLALGIATCLFIGMFIKDELSYDSHWENKDWIYRAVGHLKFADNEWEMATTPAPMWAAFKEDFPEIEEAARFRSMGSTILELDQRMIKVDQFAFADQEVFSIFSIKTANGTLDISEPNTVVISESTAKKLYGDEDAIGKSFKHYETNYKITGVYQDIPTNSHFHYELLFSMENWPNSKNKEWGSNNFRTYFLLEPGADYEQLQAKFATVYEKYFSPMLAAVSDINWDQFLESGSFVDYQLQPLESIHLYSDLSYEIEPNGSIQYIVLFGAAGLFVLIIACINFMNISTARSSTRAKEVGMRKVLGSLKRYLINQFMLESVLNAVIAALIATALMYTLLPFFNNLTDKSIADPYFGELMLFPWMIGGTLIVGLLAGVYPALYLSSFKPIKVLKGELRLGVKSGWMRNTLVIVQFSVSVILIFGAVVINSQLDFIQNKSLGFNKDQVLILNNTYMMGDKINAFVEEIRQHPTVVNATVSGFLPTGDSRSDSPMVPKESTTNDDFVSLQIWQTDEDYIPTMDMKLKEGRNFDKNLATDSNAVILNQAAVDKFGFENPVGQKLKSMGGYDIHGMKEFKVIGVIDNFHYDSFKENIDPMVLMNVESTGSIAMRFEAGKTTELIAYLDDLWQEFNPTLPFEYTFMDQQFAAKYKSEQKLSNLFNIFSGLAIFIACLGLFGLAAFTTDQRKKELGIRKVLGASLPHLMIRQLSGYTKLLVVSMVIALPIGIYLMSEWLENFVYRTDISVLMIVLPILAVVLLAWITVSIISYRAARQNPVNNLKYE